MNQGERRRELIQFLLREREETGRVKIPVDTGEQKRLLRSLLNIRRPAPADSRFLAVQDAYLQEETAGKGVTDFSSLTPEEDGLYLWQGDITTLRCDAIVNAANSGMTGCYVPCHGCIDNCIHTFAGVQLRLACARLMERQGHGEETGGAKITPAYNLPCRYVLHTVGPVVDGDVTDEDERLLASCYRSCLELADENGLKNVAFCCISTGVFRFPRTLAAQIAVRTVREYRRETHSGIEVLFNVFKDEDYDIYRGLLGSDKKPERKAGDCGCRGDRRGGGAVRFRGTDLLR